MQFWQSAYFVLHVRMFKSELDYTQSKDIYILILIQMITLGC